MRHIKDLVSSLRQSVPKGADMGILARKLVRQGAAVDFPQMPALDISPLVDPVQRAWRVSLARAARDHMKLALGFENLTRDTVGLAEVLETPMERALILILEGVGDALGLMVISPPILSGMIEFLTLSRLSPDAGDSARAPTRTDAAMVVDMIDAALVALAQNMAGDMAWSEPYRYAAFIEDPRPLHLMLEDGDYHILRANLHLEHGARQGQMMLALPVQAALDHHLPFDPPPVVTDTGFDGFAQDFSDQIAAVATHLDAVLAKVTLPLDRVLRLQVGEVVALTGAALDAIQLQGIDGQDLIGGRLGQHRGMRAIRILDTAQARPEQADTLAPQELAQVG